MGVAYRLNLLLLLGPLMGVSLSTGCGNGETPSYPITGQVTFPDGSTLKEGGKVVFFGVDTAKPIYASAYFGPDGKFELTTARDGSGIVEGTYQVSVVPSEPDDTKGLSPKEYAKLLNPINERFKNPSSSGLKFTISPETAPHDFRIEVTPPQRR